MAFCVDRVKKACEHGKHAIKVVFFFRRSYHSFSDFFLYLCMQLGSGLFAQEDIMAMIQEACKEGTSKALSVTLRKLVVALLAQDTRVYVLIDNCSPVENRILNKTLRILRQDLQPWKYPLSRDGLVRFMTSGRGLGIFGYGVLLRTFAVKPLESARREEVMEFLLQGKLVAPCHIESLISKKEADRFLYLKTAADIIRDMGSFETSDGSVERLPETLSGLYMKTMELLEMKHGFDIMQSFFHAIISTSRLELGKLEEMVQNNAEEILPKLKHSLFSLLRIPAEEDILVIDDDDLRECASKRYSADVAQLRKEEEEKRREEAARKEGRLKDCAVMVLDQVDGQVGFDSLEGAVEEAGWGDVIVVCHRKHRLSRTVKVFKDLTIRAASESRGAEIRIDLGRTGFDVRCGKEGNAVQLSLEDVRVKQTGNETVELPTCIAVHEACSLLLTRSTITSVFGIGVWASSSTVSMENALLFQCGRAAMVLERKSKGRMFRCQVMVNPLDEVPDKLGPLYQLFLHFCETKFAGSNRLSGVGKRSVTLDFSEFLAMMQSLQIHLDKTTLSSAFQRANADALSDSDRNEMSWNEFKLVLRDLCVLGSKQQVLGIDVDDLDLQAHKLSERWARANALEVTGGSELDMEESEVANAIHGVLVTMSSRVACRSCSFHYCGRENDSAAITCRHPRSSCVLKDCRFLFSEHNGLQAEGGSSCELEACSFSSSQQNAIAAHGANTHLQVRESVVSGSLKCGITASQRASVRVERTKLLRSMGAGVHATAAETTVVLVESVLEGNGQGIVCEREATVLLSGMTMAEGEIVCSRKGRVELLRAEEAPLQYQQVVGKESLRRSSSCSLRRGERKEECLERIKRFFARIFTNVAEAYVTIKQRRGGARVDLARADLCRR
eukprot:749579-Hanusia_phi.AAC.6